MVKRSAGAAKSSGGIQSQERAPDAADEILLVGRLWPSRLIGSLGFKRQSHEEKIRLCLILSGFFLVFLIGLAACADSEDSDEFEANGPESCLEDEAYDPVNDVCYYVGDDFDEDDDGYFETAEDCYDDEVYDPVDRLCYLADDADTDYEDVLDEVFGNFTGDDSQYQDLQELGDSSIIVYTVDGNQIRAAETPSVPSEWQSYQEDSATHQAIWSYFSSLIPLGQRDYISKFSIFTDGAEEVYAAVGQDADDPTRWVLAVDIVDAANQQELTYSLIHEYGHLLTLNGAQVNLDADLFYQQDNEALLEEAATSCPTFFPGEGCSNADSYINQFYQRFWSDLEGEFEEIQAIEDESRYEDALAGFYDRYADQFVTDYAATNPGEDIAESWTAFVLQPRPTGTSIADEKVLFFYEHSELVELRGQIVARAFSRLRRQSGLSSRMYEPIAEATILLTETGASTTGLPGYSRMRKSVSVVSSVTSIHAVLPEFGGSPERVMGLEPTTFCLGSRHSAN